MKPVNLFVKHFPLFLDIFYHFIVLSLSVFLFGEFGLFLLFCFMVVWSGDGRYDPSINHIRGSYLSDPPPNHTFTVCSKSFNNFERFSFSYHF